MGITMSSKAKNTLSLACRCVELKQEVGGHHAIRGMPQALLQVHGRYFLTRSQHRPRLPADAAKPKA